MDFENDTSWVRGMLQPGENLLWTGKPEKLGLFRKEDYYMIPFSVFWCGFACVMTWMVWKDGSAPLVPKLLMFAFVLAGLWLLVGRFIPRYLSAKNERYALTSQRVIIRKGNTTKSLELDNLPNMSMVQKSDGSGDIRFGSSVQTCYGASGFAFDKQRVYSNNALEFRGIADVSRVEYRIRQAMDQRREARNG